ncbi:Integrase zinc binding domain [Popillia japonica]|uniref:RNA-directed DNA polymerase n=1 Tax=Popillia japonica TaxID=7064 RepID=A0AAW1IT37_POPJA
MSSRDRDAGRKYESGSSKRKRSGSSKRKRAIKRKQILATNDTLVHYDPQLSIVISSDASNKAAVLFHEYQNKILRPIACVLRTFSNVETRYSTIDKEALAIIYAVTKFQQYLHGKPFTLLTDHNPLERIFSEKRETPKVASNRLLRWTMILNMHNYTIKDHPGKENGPADVLSRLSVEDQIISKREEQGFPERGHLLILRLKHLPITKKVLAEATKNRHDTESHRSTYTSIPIYWPEKAHLEENMLTFYEKRDELSAEEGVILWKGRICIPDKHRDQTLKMLHDGHTGICAMQSMVRLNVYWPNIDKDIENHIKQCTSCQSVKVSDYNIPLYPWSAPSQPWTRLHIDFAEPFRKIMCMELEQWKQKIRYDTGKVANKVFTEDESVWVNNPVDRGSLPGIIVEQTGPYSYIVEIDEERRRKHAD